MAGYELLIIKGSGKACGRKWALKDEQDQNLCVGNTGEKVMGKSQRKQHKQTQKQENRVYVVKKTGYPQQHYRMSQFGTISIDFVNDRGEKKRNDIKSPYVVSELKLSTPIQVNHALCNDVASLNS